MNDVAESLPSRPRLRPIEVIPVQVDGEPMLALRDPALVSQHPVVMSQAALALVALFDGTRDRQELQAEFKRRHGETVPFEIIDDVVEKLDEALLLESARYLADLTARRAAYDALELRPMTMAGECYPGEPQEAATALGGFFTLPDGPGRLPEPAGGPALAGVIAPHIDFQRGAALYAQAYLPLAEGTDDVELFVILATDHKGEIDAPFSLTPKDFETPFGRLRTDSELVERLGRQVPGLRDGELGHLKEHALEFQAVMLHHVLGERAQRVQILPVLCGSLLAFDGHQEQRDARIDAFVAALEELRAARRTCFIAGADLAHLGPAFGTDPLDQAAHDDLEQRDATTLEILKRGDPDAFFIDVMSDGNARHVCGLSAIHTLLRVLDGRPGELLGYRQCPVPGEDGGGSRVSIVAVTYPE